MTESAEEITAPGVLVAVCVYLCVLVTTVLPLAFGSRPKA